MKFVKLFGLLMLSVVFTYCGDDSDTGNTGGGDADTFWECKIDGNSYRVEGLQAYAVRFDVDNTIAVYGSEEPDAAGYRNVFIATKDDGRVGNYDLSLGGDAVGTMLDTSDGSTFISGLEGGSGSMEITNIDNEYVEGTFEFTGIGTTGSTTFSEGKFKVKFN